MDSDQISGWVDQLEKESREIKEEALKMVWYMRGGLSYEAALNLSPDERTSISKLIKDNLETTKRAACRFSKMLDLETVKQDILAWSENFVEVPHPALGGWAPCPFARRARLSGTVSIRIGMNPYFDLKNCSGQGMGKYEVIVYAYDPEEFSYTHFHYALEAANQEFLLKMIY